MYFNPEHQTVSLGMAKNSMTLLMIVQLFNAHNF